MPDATRFLFWTPAEQALGYKNIEKIFPTRVIKRGARVSALVHDAKPFDVSYDYKGAHYDTAGFMQANNSSGLIVIHHGKVLLERYDLGRTEHDRWTSFSVGKSVTSTLVGVAIRDGYIKSPHSAGDRLSAGAQTHRL